MKKLFALALALALTLALATTCFAATINQANGWPTTNSASADVTATYTAVDAADTVVSVEITFGTMAFTYVDTNEGSWDPTTRDYTGVVAAHWECADDANKITVANSSNTAITATFAYADNEEDAVSVTGKFYTAATEGTEITQAVTIATAVGTKDTAAPSTDAYLNLTGAITGNADLGTVTVTIAVAQ